MDEDKSTSLDPQTIRNVNVMRRYRYGELNSPELVVMCMFYLTNIGWLGINDHLRGV